MWFLAWLIPSVLVVCYLLFGNPELKDVNYRTRLQTLRALTGEGATIHLILGSSRVAGGVAPKEDAGGQLFNFGFSGAGPLQEYFYLRRLLRRRLPIRSIWIELWPPLLAPQNLPLEVQALEPQLSSDEAIEFCRRKGDSTLEGISTVLRGTARSGRSLLLFQVIPEWVPAVRQPKVQTDRFGWCELPLPRTADPAVRTKLENETHKKIQERIVDWQPGSEADAALRSMVELCRVNGIKPVFFVLPESPLCLGWYPHSSRQKIADYKRRLSKELEVPLLDWSETGRVGDFIDGQHLAFDAIQPCTDQLAEQVKQWDALQAGIKRF